MNRILHQIRIGEQQHVALPLFPPKFPHSLCREKATPSRDLDDPQHYALTRPDQWVAARSGWMDWWSQC